MILYYLLRSGLWRSLDGEKVRFFLGWTGPGTLSHRHPLWRCFPWARALFSPRAARGVHDWLRYRVDLFDGQAG